MAFSMAHLGRVLKTHARGQPMNIIFCPGMGGGGHADAFLHLWQGVHLQFASWTSFAAGGQEYVEYDNSDVALHPGGRPVIIGDSIGRLLALIRTFSKDEHVLLVGFSAGAYLTLRTIQEMETQIAQLQPSVSFLAMGHWLFADELMQPAVSMTPGVVIFGEQEMTPVAYMEDLWPHCDVPVAELPDYLSADSLMVSAWGSYCGDARKCALVERAFSNAHILVAMECGHSVRGYEMALWFGRMFYMSGRRLPSSLATSSRSSACSSFAPPEQQGARGRSHSI